MFHLFCFTVLCWIIYIHSSRKWINADQITQSVTAHCLAIHIFLKIWLSSENLHNSWSKRTLQANFLILTLLFNYYFISVTWEKHNIHVWTDKITTNSLFYMCQPLLWSTSTCSWILSNIIGNQFRSCCIGVITFSTSLMSIEAKYHCCLTLKFKIHVLASFTHIFPE